MTTRLYLDTRHLNANGEAMLYIAICKHGKTAYLFTGIKIEPKYWDAKERKLGNCPNKRILKVFLEDKKAKFDSALLKLEMDMQLGGLSAKQIRDKIESLLSPEKEDKNMFMTYFKNFAARRKAESTKRLYNQTYKKIEEFCPKAKDMKFEDITKMWLESFEAYLVNDRRNDVNTIAIDMRNIRAVVNDAIDNNVTTAYPFRKKYKIKQKQTRKRSLSIDKLRELFSCEVEPFMQKYLDTFKLTFFLIGINTIDLRNLTKIEDGYIIYERAKTKRLYTIKVEKEAMEIINKYKGKEKLFGVTENKDHGSFMSNLDKYLKRIGKTELMPNPNKKKYIRAKKYIKTTIPICPELSIYWARHTWATIAASLDIPKETISAALGHGIGNKTTSIYIDFDQKKIDAANRKVIDYVLYDTK